MALSGTIQKSFSRGYTLKTEWSATQDVANNTSTITCTHKLVCATSFGLYISSRSNSCIVGGVSKTFKSSAISTEGGTTITLGTTTHKISHNADGTASVALSTTFYPRADIAGTYVDNVTASGTITLNTIPRASSVTCNSFYIGDSTTITINRATANFTHTIRYTYGNLTGVIADKTTATSVGWTPNVGSFYGQIPNATTGRGTVTCETYNGETLIGTTTANFNAYAKQDDCVPTVSATIEDTNAGTSGASGSSSKIVRYISKPKVTINATAKYSSSIKSYRIAWGDGQVSTASSTTYSNGVSSPIVTVSATDSRGYTTVVTYDLSALNRWVEYIYPATTSMVADRTESTSETVNLRATANYFNGSFGASSNIGTFSYRYRTSGGTWGDWTLLSTAISGNTITGTATINGISTESPYDFQVKLSDYFNTSEIIERTVQKSIGILRVADDYVRVNGDILDRYKTKLTNGLAQYLSSNIDPNTTLEDLILTQANTPTSAFWYVRTMFFKEKSAVARRTQIAYPYAYDTQWVETRIFTRVYIENSGWTAWKAIGEETKTTANSVGQSLVGSNLSIEWATVVITPSAANVPTPQRIYFNKTYEKAPIVLPVVLTASPGVEVKGVSIVGITTGYASLSVTRATTAATTIHFAVIGKVV